MVITNAIDLEFRTEQVSPRRERLVNARLSFPTSTDFASDLEKAVGKLWPHVSEQRIDPKRAHKDFYGRLSWLNPFNAFSYSPVRLVTENGTRTLELEPSRFPITSFGEKRLYLMLEYLALIAPISLESMPFYKQLLELREKFHVLNDAQYRNIMPTINARIMKEGKYEPKDIYLTAYERFFMPFFETARERYLTGKERYWDIPMHLLKRMLTSAISYADSKQDSARKEKLSMFRDILNRERR